MKAQRLPFIQVNQGVFFIDEDTSDDYILRYVTEMNTQTYIIKQDCTLHPPYFELFREWRERQNGKMRTLNERLFASSKLEKIINYINTQLN
ncbi:MAG: hypothetical protein NC548_24330 [Lachnospiraceae bacterium]|nr:hypothetical protein [Lachnospiraceae bacterium]